MCQTIREWCYLDDFRYFWYLIELEPFLRCIFRLSKIRIYVPPSSLNHSCCNVFLSIILRNGPGLDAIHYVVIFLNIWFRQNPIIYYSLDAFLAKLVGRIPIFFLKHQPSWSLLQELNSCFSNSAILRPILCLYLFEKTSNVV